MPDHHPTTRLELSARPPFVLASVALSHGWVRLPPFGWDGDAGELQYVAQLDTGRAIHVCVRDAPTKRDLPSGVTAQVDGELSDVERKELKRQISWMLGLNQAFDEFYALTRDEPKLAKMEARAQGRLLRCPTLFEDVVKTILTTNTSWAGTVRMVEALVGQFDDPLPGDRGRRAFPSPERLASTDEATLRQKTRLGYRAPYVLALARDVAAGTRDLEALKSSKLPTPELRKRLLAIKGVGNYAAASLLMLLGRYDDVPVDSWARSAVSREWYDGAPVGRAEVEAAFERWGEWKGLAYWFWEWSPEN